MEGLTIEGVVDGGQIKLKSDIRLPDHTKVYVVVPDLGTKPAPQIISPRLKNPTDAADFTMEVMREPSDAIV